MASLRYESLHCHTLVSDGELTHKQVLDTAQQNNISAVAFTDHDSVPDENTLKELDKLWAHSTKRIVGVEISSGLPKEAGGGPSSGFHVVGLFVDPTNAALLEHCRKAQEARVVRMQKMVRNLRELGFNVTEQDCLAASGSEAVARPHIV